MTDPPYQDPAHWADPGPACKRRSVAWDEATREVSGDRPCLAAACARDVEQQRPITALNRQYSLSRRITDQFFGSALVLSETY
jgi:hypothetical protein